MGMESGKFSTLTVEMDKKASPILVSFMVSISLTSFVNLLRLLLALPWP